MPTRKGTFTQFQETRLIALKTQWLLLASFLYYMHFPLQQDVWAGGTWCRELSFTSTNQSDRPNPSPNSTGTQPGRETQFYLQPPVQDDVTILCFTGSSGHMRSFHGDVNRDMCVLSFPKMNIWLLMQLTTSLGTVLKKLNTVIYWDIALILGYTKRVYVLCNITLLVLRI